MSMTPKRRGVVIASCSAFALLLLFGGIVWSLLTDQNGPRYRGLTVLQWSERMQSLPTDDLAAQFGTSDPQAVAFLIEALKHEPPPLSRAYASVHAKLPVRIQDLLLRPTDPARVRGQSANLLGLMRSNAVPAIPALIEALSDAEDRVRMNASGALKAIRVHAGRDCPTDPQTISALIGCLRDKNPDIRWNAASSMYFFGKAATSAIPALESARQDPDQRIRAAATNTLRLIRRSREH